MTANEETESSSGNLSHEEYGKRVQKGEALWLMSFSDMSLVLLCFFVLLLTMMSPDKSKFENVREGFVEEARKDVNSLTELEKKIRRKIKEKKLESAVGVLRDNDGLHIEFKNAVLFSSGSARTNPKYSKVVNGVLEVIATTPRRYQMSLKGHTDDAALSGRGKHRSNWELSAARGFTMMRSFLNLGVPDEQMSVMAYAHTRPKVPYKKLKGRALKKARSKNRRVEVTIN